MKNVEIRKILWRLIVILLVCGLVCCGQRGARSGGPTSSTSLQKPAADSGKKGPGQSSQQEEDRKTRIRSVLLTPITPRADSRITANTDIFPVINKDEGEVLSYVFYKNTEIFKEQEENSLPPGSCKRGDSLFADVILSKYGEEIERKRSGIIFVLNSKPEIGEVEFPEIRGLGTYSIVVNASDADEDTLTFLLDEKYGIPAGMFIDQRNGIISYSITRPPEQDVKFKVKVKDKSGGEDWRELLIKFSRSTVRQNVEEES